MNCIVVCENRKRLSFKITEVKEDTFFIFRISRFCKFTAKKLLKKINKKRISKVAFDNNIPREFKEYFEGKISIIKNEDVLFLNIDKIILKASKTLGIKDGKLNLGIVAGYKNDILFKILLNLRKKLKTLTVFCDDPAKTERYAELYYKQTGIPVVIKKEDEIKDCDILVYLKSEYNHNINFDGKVIDIFSITDTKAIRDVTLKFKKNKNDFNISDGAFCKIIDSPFEIKGFITKNT